MNTVISTALRSVGAYFFLLLVSRIMGRKMISQMTFFDFVVSITVGSVTANLALGPQSTALSAATVLVVLTVLTILMDFAHLKSFIFRKMVNSEPVVVIENGGIVSQNMHKVRMTVDQLMMMLREKKIFNIADVEFAIIETNGQLSVLPKSQKQPVTPSDLNIATGYKGLTRDIIMDGNIMHENLKAANLDEQWLMEQLKGFGVRDIREVFYAGLDSSGNLYVSKKEKDREKHGQHGIE